MVQFVHCSDYIKMETGLPPVHFLFHFMVSLSHLFHLHPPTFFFLSFPSPTHLIYYYPSSDLFVVDPFSFLPRLLFHFSYYFFSLPPISFPFLFFSIISGFFPALYPLSIICFSALVHLSTFPFQLIFLFPVWPTLSHPLLLHSFIFFAFSFCSS